MCPDPAASFLVDVREMSINDVEPTGSALDRALERILVSDDTCDFRSVNSSI